MGKIAHEGKILMRRSMYIKIKLLFLPENTERRPQNRLLLYLYIFEKSKFHHFPCHEDLCLRVTMAGFSSIPRHTTLQLQ